MKEARRYLDSVVIGSRQLSEVNITPVVQEKFSGSWFTGKNTTEPRVTVLYFHGGGYSFYPQAYAQLYRADHAGCEIQNLRPRLPSLPGTSIPGAT